MATFEYNDGEISIGPEPVSSTIWINSSTGIMYYFYNGVWRQTS